MFTTKGVAKNMGEKYMGVILKFRETDLFEKEGMVLSTEGWNEPAEVCLFSVCVCSGFECEVCCDVSSEEGRDEEGQGEESRANVGSG